MAWYLVKYRGNFTISVITERDHRPLAQNCFFAMIFK
jgi:hypothetical protein